MLVSPTSPCPDLISLPSHHSLRKSLAPLSACTGLRELRLDGVYSVKDLAPISTCVSLRVLSSGAWNNGPDGDVDADGCSLDTLNHLLPLTQLVTLNINCGGVESLTESIEGLVSALSQLQSLSLAAWRGEDEEPLELGVLSSLTGLSFLALEGDLCEDLSWLPSCTSLVHVVVRDSFDARQLLDAGFCEINNSGHWIHLAHMLRI
jgi:hypothetical protein